ncbi:MAG TPA: glycosyltransferase family 2 protein [Candidatus Anoxymicrobiaceae bacterium]
MKAVAVVPAYNEEDIIGGTVESLLSLDRVERVVVIDDASADESGRRAIEAGATVIVNGTNLGKGGSLNRVLEGLDFEVVLLIDGDLGPHAKEAAKVLGPVLSGEADLAIAAFPAAVTKGGFGLTKGLAQKGIRLLTGLQMRSPISGQRAMTRAAYEAVAPFREGFGVEVAMTVDAHRSGLRIVEVEAEMSHRETGRDLAGFLHRGRQFADIAKALMARALRRAA